MVQEGPEGFSTEAALCLLYNGLILYMVLTAVALSMVLTGHKRRYTARRAMITDPNAPLCECGQYKCQKIKGWYRKKCNRCRRNKEGSSAATQAATASSSADRPARTKAQKRERQAAAMDEFYADCLKSDRYCAEFKLLLCCFNCVVLSSVVCETGFSVLKTIKTKARNKLLVVTLDALMCVATLTRLLTQELAHLFMTVSDLAERAYDVWNDGTRCAARSHPGVAHKRRQRHFTMLDTYDSLEWEKKDNEDEDAEVIGACDSDKDEEEEAGEASADDTADVSDSEVVLTEEQKIEMRKSHGKCLSIRKGWRILSKDEGIARIQAVGTKKSSRPWKLVHLWDVEGWLEGAVVRRIGKQRKYETRYPGERPVDHDLRSEEYGPGGWTDEQQQIWIVIVKDSR